MTADQDLARHQDTYRGFTKFLLWLSATVVVVIVILAFVTL
jgi:Bacterial aa3 type cytochrome c oxidase subunit IV